MKYEEYVERMKNASPIQDIEIKRNGTWFYHTSRYASVVRVGDGEFSNLVIKLPEEAHDANGNILTLAGFDRDLFRDRTYLTDIILPSSIGSILGEAFSGCSSLRRITIPKGVRVIDEGTFAGCSCLADIYYEGTRQEWEEIRIVHYRYECDFGGLIPGTPVQKLAGERYMMIPGNEALFCANIHFRCDLRKLYHDKSR